MIRLRKGFTLVEIIMVIVVFGIVASIGADIIASMYENYLRTRAINRLQGQSEIVLEQIAKRLQYRIKDSAIAKIDNANFLPLPHEDVNASYNIMEWIGTSNESLLGNGSTPGWSGLIDLESAETNNSAGTFTIKTPGSDLSVAEQIIYALTNTDVNLSDNAKNTAAIIFKGKDDYNVSKYYNEASDNYTIMVRRDTTAPDDDRFITNTSEDNVTNNQLYEQYYLSHTAYAIVPGTGNDFNITLHYNYQPWEGDTYLDGDQEVLVEHASTFRFTQIGETIRFKLCITDGNQSTTEFEFGACKEKVVY